IIGFISTEWINSSDGNSILDGAPSSKSKTDNKRKNADILLCKGDKPFIPVEVETNVSKYRDKLESLGMYLDDKKNFDGARFGLMIMLNFCKNKATGELYKHNWNKIKEDIVKNKKHNIVLVSIEKENKKKQLTDSTLDNLRERNNYYPWDIVEVKYWIYYDNKELEGDFIEKK
ncbi:MAG: hypothetical protein KJ851_03030, partial [Nanoarchaeota archaeon]|nr:hypothetical protein [Nanoarchaeota archaeon]